MNQYEMQQAMLDEMRRQQQAQLMQQLAAQQQAPVMQAPQMNMPAPNIQMPVAERSGFQITPQQGMAAMSALRSEPMQIPQMNVSGPNVIPIAPVNLGDSGGDMLGMASKLIGSQDENKLNGLLSLISKMGGM